MAAGVDGPAKFMIFDRRTINPEPVDGNALRRRLFGTMRVRPHAKHAAVDKTMLAKRPRSDSDGVCKSTIPLQVSLERVQSTLRWVGSRRVNSSFHWYWAYEG